MISVLVNVGPDDGHESRLQAALALTFGHNRLREMLLGSATQELLEKSSRPLLLSH